MERICITIEGGLILHGDILVRRTTFSVDVPTVYHKRHRIVAPNRNISARVSIRTLSDLVSGNNFAENLTAAEFAGAWLLCL